MTAHKNYRSADPDTSMEAGIALEESGSAKAQRDILVEFVRLHDGWTSAEIEDATGICAHKRLPEARKEGRVYNPGKRECYMTGKRAQTWKYVDPDEVVPDVPGQMSMF